MDPNDPMYGRTHWTQAEKVGAVHGLARALQEYFTDILNPQKPHEDGLYINKTFESFLAKYLQLFGNQISQKEKLSISKIKNLTKEIGKLAGKKLGLTVLMAN